MSAQTIEFFFDIGSPYSYLAATQMPKLAERTGTRVHWRPFLLGAVFKATGNGTPARVQAKARWMVQDLAAWADHYGVQFQLSRHFPLNTLTTQRALVAAERLAGEDAVPAFALDLFDRYWVADTDVSQPDAIRASAEAVGLDATAILGATSDPETKDRLREHTDESVRRGAFGAPTFFVGDRMFWGNDRLHLVEVATQACAA